MNEQSPLVLIVGSCVSRDIFEFDSAGCTLDDYIARTSMASIGAEPVIESRVREAAESLQSPFQRKMALNDMNKTTLDQVAQSSAHYVLVDFVDERFPLVLSGKSYYSLTGELQKAGMSADGNDVIQPGDPAYFTLWLKGFERFVACVGAERIILNRALWAVGTSANPTAFSKTWVARNNALLASLYDLVESRWRLKTLRYPEALIVGNAHHKWGEAPYHFEDELYCELATQIRQLTSGGDIGHTA